jgi:hypothetical protein
MHLIEPQWRRGCVADVSGDPRLKRGIPAIDTEVSWIFLYPSTDFIHWFYYLEAPSNGGGEMCLFRACGHLELPPPLHQKRRYISVVAVVYSVYLP